MLNVSIKHFYIMAWSEYLAPVPLSPFSDVTQTVLTDRLRTWHKKEMRKVFETMLCSHNRCTYPQQFCHPKEWLTLALKYLLLSF